MDNIKDFIEEQNKKILSSGFNKDELNAPLPLTENEHKTPLFPLAALGEGLYEFTTKIHEITQAPITMCAQSVLGAVSLAVQPYGNVIIDGRRYPCSAFFFTIGLSGERKSTVDRIVLEPMRQYERELTDKYEIENATFQMEKDNFTNANKKDKKYMQLPTKPLEPIIIVQEPTYEGLIRSFEHGQGSMGIFSDEGGRFIYGYGMNSENKIKTIAGLCELWDGNAITRIRVSEGAKKLYGKRLSFHLMMQPKVARGFLQDEATLDQGFLWRCLFASPESRIGKRPYKTGDIFSHKAYLSFAERISSIVRTPLPLYPGKRNEINPKAISIDDKAKALLVDFYNEVELEQNTDGKFVHITGFASKAMEHACRLAGILTLYDNVHASVISSYRMIDAIKLVRFYLAETLRLFSSAVEINKVSTIEQINLAKTLLGWLKTYLLKNNQDTISMREMVRLAPYSVRKKETLTKLMDILLEHEWAFPTGAISTWKVRTEFFNTCDNF